MNFDINLFIEKVDKIIDSLSSIDDEKNEAKGNLIASFYLELTAMIAANPKYKNLILEISKQDPKTPEEYVKVLEYSMNKSKEMGIYPSDELNQASQKVLSNFIHELNLPQDKSAELKKLSLSTYHNL